MKGLQHLPLRPAAALLSKDALEHNLRQIRRRIRDFPRLHRKDAQVMAIVKADAYGHDLRLILPELEKKAIDYFAVASLEEGVQARRLARSPSKILVLGGTLSWTPEAIELARSNRLEVAVNNFECLKALIKSDLPLHLKFDTGMNRLGLKPDDWSSAFDLVKKTRRPLKGLFTHFATSGDAIFERQVLMFEEVVRWFRNERIEIECVHSENSGALFDRPQKSGRGILAEVGNLIRPGISMYGYHPRGVKSSISLKPVLELVAEVGVVKNLEKGEGVSYGHLYHAKKPHTYGVVPLGYADGLSKAYAEDLRPEWRTASGKKKGNFRILGAICMDMVMVKAEQSGKKIEIGDRCVFWGRFKNQMLSKGLVEAYELNLRIIRRIPRIWVSGNDE